MTLEFLQPLSAGISHNPLTALGITFAGGIVTSAVCPCTVPMGLGVAGLAGASQVRARYGGLQVSAAFFAGIVISLTALGGAAGRLGALATEAFGRDWALGMAVLSLVAAALALWWPRMPIDRLVAWRKPGVVGVEVSLEKRNARVTYFANLLTPDQIVTAIDKLGYTAGTPKDAP